MTQFHYEWWIVKITYMTGTFWFECKAKSKEGAIKQIRQEAKKNTVVDVDWNSLTLDRIGYQRLS